jgi:hypothetical protein
MFKQILERRVLECDVASYLTKRCHIPIYSLQRSSGQSSWLQIQSSRGYEIFLEVVGLERGPLSLVRITQGLLE